MPRLSKILLASFITLFSASLWAVPGALDTTFGGGAGWVSTGFQAGPADDNGSGMIRQADGKLVVVGDTQTGFKNFAVTRYNVDGSLDATFGTGGKVVTAVGTSNAYGRAVAQQSDGKLIVVGDIFNGTNEDFALVRYNTDGSLDVTFGTGGKVTTGVGSEDYAYAVLVQTDGKIVAAGKAFGANNDFALVRYNSDGSLDTTFNATGKVVTTMGTADDVVYSIIQQADGKLVAAGGAASANYDVGVARYTTAGALDTTFNTTGKVLTTVGTGHDYARSVIQQADGKLVVAGYSSNATDDFIVVRYTAAGALDTTFNTTGKVTTTIGTGLDQAYSIVQDAGGKLVVAGVSAATNNDFAVVRYTTAGALDTTFNTTGKVVTAIGTGIDTAYSVIVQPDGMLVAAGTGIGAGGKNDFALARYTSAGALDTGFNTTGKVLTDVGGISADYATSLVVQADGKLVAAGYINTALPTADQNFALARFTSTGALDTTFNGTGKVNTLFNAGRNEFAYGVIQQADGKLVAAGYARMASGGDDFALARYNADGTLDTTFNATGKVTTAIGTSADQAKAIVQQADGKLVIAGNVFAGTNMDFGLARYNSNGSLDTTFNTTGKVTTAIGISDEYANAVIQQADGKLVAAGYSNSAASGNDFAVVRYNADGSLDTTFGGTGKVLTAIAAGTGIDQALSIVQQGDGKLVAAGYTNNGANTDFAVVRYNTDGSLDTTFNTTGIVTTVIGASNEQASSITRQSDGKLVVAGYSYSGTTDDFAVVRYNVDGSLDTAFGTGGKVTSVIGSSTDRAVAIASQSDGKLVVAGYAAGMVTGQEFIVARYESGVTAGACTAPQYWNGSSCVDASAGHYVSTDGATSETACAVGTYQPLTGQTSCTPASAGSFVAGTGAISQTACAAGSFTSTTGQSSCTPAPAGSFVSGTGATSATQCAAGSFTSTTGNTSCTPAPAGSYATGPGAISSTLCAAGSYTSTTGNSSCTPASAGSFVAGTGAISQTACAAGSFTSTTGQSSCTPAPAGSFVSGTGATSATQCAAGSFTSTTGNTSCTPAPAGSYATGPGAISSTLCVAGSFTSTTGQAFCTPAPAGSFVSGTGATSATQCAAGSFTSTTGNTSCTPAPAGSYATGPGAISSTLCAAGSYTSTTGNSSCTPASAGSFVAGTGAISQTACAAGSFTSTTGQSSCTPAPAGSFVSGTGATSATQCAAGSFTSTTGNTSCTPAPAGSYATGPGATSSTLCAAGSYTSTSGNSSCTISPANFYVSTMGATSPTACPINTTSPAGSTSAAACVPTGNSCLAGTWWNGSVCVNASAGNYVPIDGATSETACAVGTYQPLTGQTSCTPASAGSFVSGTGAISQTACAAGSFTSTTGQSSCTPAPAGSFVSGTGATSATLCAAGSFTSTTGNTSCTAASAGSFVSGTGAISQTACAAGSFTSTTGNSSCTLAPAGTYVSGTGATSATPAPAGSYATGPGATGSTLCAAGSYTSTSGQATCTLASAGFYVPGTGAMSQIACASGYTSLPGATVCFIIDVRNDFGGDYKSDILLRNSTTGELSLAELNGLTVLSQGTVATYSDSGQVVLSTGDFDNDGAADILTRGSVVGIFPGRFRVELLAAGGVVTSAAWMDTMSTNLNDVVVSVQDYNGDGYDDVLLRNTATGVWTMNYMQGTSAPTIGVLNASTDLCYTMKSDGDYDGNGYPDLLLRKDACGGTTYPWLVVLTDGDFIIASSGIVAGLTMNTGWGIQVADQDFNSDGKDDVLMRALSGTPQQWLMYNMNGAAAVTGIYMNNVAVQSMWQFVGDADFNGDGKRDIMIRSVDTGQWYAYLLDNTNPIGNDVVYMNMNPSVMSLQALDDNNGDGRSDILLRNTATGNWTLHLMNSLVIQQKGTLAIIFDLGYTLEND